MSNTPIRFERLTHFYGSQCALHDLTLSVPEGSIYALLGRNGAGKTTALKCLLGFQTPTRGRAEILGHDCMDLPPAERERIGYVAEGQQLVPWMRVDGLVKLQARSFRSFDVQRCHEWLDRLGLPRKRRVFRLSRGMRAQLALALALATHPKVVILDDPAMGLDAVVRREFLEVMIELIQEEGRTLLFTSHILQDVERVADRVGILVDGVLRVDATVETLKERVQRYRCDLEEAPADLEGVLAARRMPGELALTVVGEAAEIEQALREHGATHVDAERMTLEDLFIDYTGRKPREVAA
jgi:ABC-2 type transport system ATP-binding protein